MYAKLGVLAQRVTSNLNKEATITPTTEVLYRVRKTWADSKTQKGAYKVLKNAKVCADKNQGYAVFDEKGTVVYNPWVATVTPTTPAFVPYKVKVDIRNLNIRKGPGTNYGKTGKYTGVGVFTIVEEAKGTGATKWGKLKSGAGWISLDYTKKV